MSVKLNEKNAKAVLKISPVKAEDEATYKCEITYLEVIDNCDVVQIVKLKTLKIPEKVIITEDNEKKLSNSTVLGPKTIGASVDLACEAVGGKPVPKVRWFNGTNELKRAEYSSGKSVLQLTLSRGDLLARYECRVESEALDEPIISWIQIDVYVPPAKVELTGVKNHVVQGTNVLLICKVPGARPAATVRWANGTIPITNTTMMHTNIEDNQDGTFTTRSSLAFKATRYDNGRTFYCYAENKVMSDNGEPELQGSIILNVRYPPVITLSPLYIEVNETTPLSERGDTLLRCNFFANPQTLSGIVWAKDGKNLTLNDTNKYNGGTIEIPSVYIKNVVRDDMGEYTCSLTNDVGTETSEQSIFLNVQYPPDVEVVMEPSTPIKSIEKSTVLLECNVTSGNPSTLEKVRWFLDGQLMKEFPECNYTSYDENGVGEGSGGPFCGLDPSILSLEKVDETFCGNYTCQGKNLAGWGRESEPRELIVYYPPSPAKLQFYPKTVVKGGSVTLECTVDSPGRPDNLTYIWYRGIHQMHEITTSNFTISPVGLETRSNFTCTAENEGGKSEPATVYIDVKAPPKFIQKLPTYQGVLYSSEHINLTCIVECYPECSMIWKKDGVTLNTTNNSLYRVETTRLPPDYRNYDFDSVNSTLIWNLDLWPGKKLNKSTPNSHYTCISMANTIGAGVNSTIEIAVDYPPEDVHVTPKFIDVIEHQAPSPVKCHGEGHPTLTYRWRKNATSEPISNNEELVLGPMKRSDSGGYMCEARNKHGIKFDVAYFNVQYAPKCIVSEVKNSNPALLCTVDANPQNVTFIWKFREGNETFMVTSNIESDGYQSYLFLDTSVDVDRIYFCTANNTVGSSVPCQRNVPGNPPWWTQLNQDKMIIIIASIIAIIVIVIIICVIIIILCRRKRADTKYSNPLEMEERENPDGNCGHIGDLSKWPLQPGVLVRVNKMHGVSISQLSPRISPFKTTTVTRAKTYLKYKRNRNKVYARLERLKELLGIHRSPHHVPIGIKESASGVVTFKKVKPSTPVTRSDAVISRKRKKPGEAPNPSSIGDKARLGAAPPVGGTADPLSDPDKGFYENLPFHGMQNPPNKPISVIAPFTQANTVRSFTSSSKSSLFPTKNVSATSFETLSTQNIQSKVIKRNKSFHGFQNGVPTLINSPPYFSQTGMVNPAFLSSFPSHQFSNIPDVYHSNIPSQNVPKILSQLPSAFKHTSGFNTVSAISFQNRYNSLHKSYGNINKRSQQQKTVNNLTSVVAPQPKRIVGRNEEQFDVRRTASGINLPQNNNSKMTRNDKLITRKSYHNRKLGEKRFSSLDVKKQKSYSPTFYSVRSKKNPKRKSIIFAMANGSAEEILEFSDKPQRTEESKNETYSDEIVNQQPQSKNDTENDRKECFENLTDSIQIMEQSMENTEQLTNETPVPAPRARKPRKSEIVYANISPAILSTNSEASNSSGDTAEGITTETTVIEVQVHTSGEADNDATIKLTDATPAVTDSNNDNNPNITEGLFESNKESIIDTNNKTENIEEPNSTNRSDISHKFMAISPKINRPKPVISSHALKNSPVLKVSPNFIKPKTESPKGALSQQIKAKIKASPAQSPGDNPDKTILTDMKDDDKTSEPLPEIPQMPILKTQIKWSPNIANFNNQNAFYTLTTPHFKQLNTVVPPQYSATIPHQKHAKLMPKALFQEPLPKSKSFSSKSKQKKHHFQIPLQKCHSFKFQTAESYFQPIKNIHEENLMRNGYLTDYPESRHHGRHHKRDKPKQKTKGPLVLRRPSDYQENIHFQENMQNSVLLQYPQPVFGRSLQNVATTNKPNGVVYADLDMPTSNNKQSPFDLSLSTSKTKTQKSKPKTEYATLKFNEVGQEIDV